MRIYIASSWKNQHAVELLTDLLEDNGYSVASFITEARRINGPALSGKFDVETWIASEDGEHMFIYDLQGACHSDVVIYLGPSGTDAWAEVGAAWASDVPILGLWAKGEPAGLMRRMMEVWFTDFRELLEALEDLEREISPKEPAQKAMHISLTIQEEGKQQVVDISPPPCIGLSVCGGGCESCPSAVGRKV